MTNVDAEIARYDALERLTYAALVGDEVGARAAMAATSGPRTISGENVSEEFRAIHNSHDPA